MKITKFLMGRPVLFWSLIVGIIIAGVLSFIQMPKLEDPAVAGKQAMVVIPYMGATAHEVELKVAQLMEEELRTLPKVRKIKSECKPGMAMITVEFEWTLLMKDLEQSFDLLRRKVNDAKGRLPQDCYDPIVVDDMMDVYGIFYSLTGPGYTFNELNDYAKVIKRELLSVPGVKRINIVGNRSEVINIRISKEKIARNGLIPTQLMMNLQNAGKVIPAGNFQNGSDKVQFRISNAIDNEDDIRDMLIQTHDGKQVRLGDIATIEREYAEPQRNGFFVNGEPALAICLTMEGNAVVPDVGKAVDKKLAEVMKRIPVGMTTDKIFFQPDKVDEAIDSFMLNLLESVLIVIIVLIFAMGFRSGVIIGSGLVLTIALSFPILLCMGTTLQRISLGAFIVAMGMLVDNSIVIMDGILIDRRRGYGPKTYLYRIGQNTAMPLLGATIIAASTFIGIFLSPDTAGEYAGDLFLVLSVSLLASWILALTQVPVFSKTLLPARDSSARQNTSKVMNSPMHRFVRSAIDKLIEYKKTTIAVSVALLVFCMANMVHVKNLFFPDFDYKQFVVEYYLPSQTDPDKVKHDLLEMTEMLRKNEHVERVAASMGCAPAHYCLVRPMTNGGDCYGELIVDTKDYNTLVEQLPIIRDQLRSLYPDAYIRLRKYNFSIGTSHLVEVQFSGPDPEVLRRLSAKAEAIMRKSQYVDPYSVQNNWNPTGKSIIAEYNRQDGLRCGIERSDVGNALQAATDGLTVGVINDHENQVLINLQVRNADGSHITELGDIPVWSTLNLHAVDVNPATLMTGAVDMNQIKEKMFTAVPLSAVARNIHMGWEENLVYRVNGERAIEAECDPNSDLYEATAAKLKEDVKEEIDAIPLPDGYSRKWLGESETSDDALVNMLKYVPITMFLILGLLLLLFNNWKKVALILICFPFVFCGIVPTLILFKQPFTFMAIIGFMGLMGMMIKNSIVLIDEINRLQTEEKVNPYKAVVEATVSRVRPVIMASLTTILGMIPLLPDPMYSSMAITIMSGLTVGTLITLVLLPIFYTAFFHIRKP
ncbi:MAG: efflux RND transporter permease subunit [Paludibacteraceae bacterium]|nr:efflux RND transporter permease subunit [Paludibacteraceae bacterium]